MSCSRSSCPSIMCDTYVDGVGYVCRECQTEFKEYLVSNGIVVNTEGEIKRELKKFMDTEKDTYTKGAEMSVCDFFNSYSRDNIITQIE
jgi:hypothetical protein